jgi:ATP-dependent Clp protease protease subunit
MIVALPLLCPAEVPSPTVETKKPVLVASVTLPDSEVATVSEAPEPVAAHPDDPSVNQIQDEIDLLTLEKNKLNASMALTQAKLDKELAESRAKAERLQTEAAELRAQQELNDLKNKVALDGELASLKKEYERVTLQSNIVKAQTETESAEIRRLENAIRRETVKLTSAMELHQKQAEARTYAMADPSTLTEPLQGNKLVISDRRVALNGPITMQSADQIIARISYYNNKDHTLPIFLVIDDSPGGSVMAGYKILKTMQGSQAPVYVVVKSFAASMAACLTTLAKKSFAYPNAVIMHHQISAFGGGNLTQQQEWVKEMEEWWRRLADPVAAKMGITRDEFIKQMYAHASTGDWNEFGDKAKELKWVDVIVDEIDETAMVRDPLVRTGTSTLVAGTSAPAEENSLSSTPTLMEQLDEKGRPCMGLPRVNPLDCYWIYNPDGYYRVR